MTYIDLLNAFNQWLETNYLPLQSQIIWYKLIHLFNKCGWGEWVSVDNLRLMSMTGINSEKSLILYRDKLISENLFEFRKGKKGVPNQYRICTVKFTVQSTVETTVQSTVKSAVKTTVESAVKTTVESADINKTKIKTKTKTNIEKEIKKKKSFIPPHLFEVEDYVKEKSLNVDAKKFYDYFTAGNWIDSKGNPVKNWKQKILTWNTYATPKNIQEGVKPNGDSKEKNNNDTGLCNQSDLFV